MYNTDLSTEQGFNKQVPTSSHSPSKSNSRLHKRLFLYTKGR